MFVQSLSLENLFYFFNYSLNKHLEQAQLKKTCNKQATVLKYIIRWMSRKERIYKMRLFSPN